MGCCPTLKIDFPIQECTKKSKLHVKDMDTLEIPCILTKPKIEFDWKRSVSSLTFFFFYFNTRIIFSQRRVFSTNNFVAKLTSKSTEAFLCFWNFQSVLSVHRHQSFPKVAELSIR